MPNNIEHPMERSAFRKHMQGKIDQWQVKRCDLGDDFAVFKFPYKYKCTEAINNLKFYNEYYGYSIYQDDEHLAIVNRGDHVNAKE